MFTQTPTSLASSVIHVSHQISLPGLTGMTGRAALGIHLWLSRVTVCESPGGSPTLTLISSHLEGALDQSGRLLGIKLSVPDMEIAATLSSPEFSLSPREGAVKPRSELSIPMACDGPLAAPSVVSHSQKYVAYGAL